MIYGIGIILKIIKINCVEQRKCVQQRKCMLVQLVDFLHKDCPFQLFYVSLNAPPFSLHICSEMEPRPPVALQHERISLARGLSHATPDR